MVGLVIVLSFAIALLLTPITGPISFPVVFVISLMLRNIFKSSQR
jgi:hypothetical protein